MSVFTRETVGALKTHTENTSSSGTGASTASGGDRRQGPRPVAHSPADLTPWSAVSELCSQSPQ